MVSKGLTGRDVLDARRPGLAGTIPLAFVVTESASPSQIVILGESGVSSTPQLFDSIINALEYWAAPVSRAMTTGYAAAFSRRTAPEVCKSFASS
jgi:hypothetical protein